jgi:hypothetical protein
MSEHVIEIAKALVKVKDGDVEVLTKPLIRSCPLRSDLYGCDEENSGTVEKVLRMHIREHGMYGPDRVLELIDELCTIDQVKGYAKTVEAGFKRIVVTITGHKALEAERLLEMGKIVGVKPIIFSVHNTGISDEEAQTLAKYCDVVWACVSKAVREIVGNRFCRILPGTCQVLGEQSSSTAPRKMETIICYSASRSEIETTR